MGEWQAIVTLLIFVATIVLIVTDWLHLTVSALLGALLLIIMQIMSLEEAIGFIGQEYETLILFFGVMVIVSMLELTGAFEYLAFLIVVLAKGEGKRLLLIIFMLTTFFSSFLPNATTVMLLAPMIPFVVALLPVIKGYTENLGLVGQEFSKIGQFPPEVFVLYCALLYGATLGGNGTVIKASANIVAAGISEQYGYTINFKRFLRFGLIIMPLQLLFVALYLTIRFL